MQHRRDNLNPPPMVVFVVYDPEADAYMTARVSCGSGHCTYWSKDMQRAKHFQKKRDAIHTMMAIEHERNGKLEVRMLDD